MRDGRRRVAVLFVDLDHFKTVNDSFGHAYGDQVIVTASRRIRPAVRDADTAARLGGDEFAILAREGVGRRRRSSALAERVLDALRRPPMRLGELTVTVGGSVGIALAVAGRHHRDAAAQRRPGDVPGEAPGARPARQLRRRHVRRGGQPLPGRGGLQAAVAADGIDLAYQPIVDIRTGDVVGARGAGALDRPALRRRPPSEFVPVAEQTGLIRELGQRLIEQACRELAQWRARTGADSYVSVNVSPLQLDELVPDRGRRIARATAVSRPSALVLEVTEGLMLVERSRDAASGSCAPAASGSPSTTSAPATRR